MHSLFLKIRHMKKTMLITIAITLGIFVTVIYSCSKDAQKSIATETPAVTEEDAPTPYARLAQTTTTVKLTKEIMDLGVTRITLLSNTSSEYVFQLTATALQYNGLDSFNVDKQIVKLTLDRAFIIMEYENGRRLHYHTGKKKVFFEVDGQQVPLSEWTSESVVLSKEEEDRLTWGLIALNEFVNNSTIRYVGGLQRAKHGSWVTYNVGTSRGTSLRRTQNEAASFLRNNPNCSQVGEFETSCIFDNHACMTSVHYNCN